MARTPQAIGARAARSNVQTIRANKLAMLSEMLSITAFEGQAWPPAFPRCRHAPRTPHGSGCGIVA
eukprot:9478568-Pyramimonas_sp.AAC.1